MADLMLLCFLPILLPSLTQLANANPRKEVVVQKCEETNSQNPTQFLENYKASAEMVRKQLRKNLFGFGIMGEPPNRVYVMTQCHHDLSNVDCLSCFQNAYEMLSGCIPAEGGRIYLDGCFMRAENYSFYGDAPSYSQQLCGTNMEDKDEREHYSIAVREAFDHLVEKIVANGESFWYLSKRVSGTKKVYVSGICWKMTNKGVCYTCLDNATKSILHCLPKTEGRITNDNCFLRYADYPFLNQMNGTTVRNVLIRYASYAVVMTFGCILAIAFGVLAGNAVHVRLHRGRSKVLGIDMNSPIFRSIMNFKYSTLEKATYFFNEMNKLGEGASSEVFKGCLEDGREIAVKRFFLSCKTRSDEICNEMYILSQIEHKNLVRFLGCCLTDDVTLFVYEFLPNKSLDNFLSDPEKRKELDWKKRFGIITGTAEGIQYLHNDCGCLIVHRDIKASNILLDLRYRPKVADFGLARFCSDDMSLEQIPICGTIGYMAPEYMAHGQLNEKIDVYSFGVLVLEIVSGIQNNKFNQDESLDTLVTIAWKHFQSNTVKEIVDEYLEIDDMEDVIRVIHVGLLCTQRSPSLRPTMTLAIEMLIRKDLDLPTPSKPPFIANTTWGSHPLFSYKNTSEPMLSSSCKPHYGNNDNQ